MRKHFFAVIILLLSFKIIKCQSIVDSTPSNIHSKTATDKFFKTKKNNIKINLSSLVLNNYSFFYERLISKKISLSAGYRYMPKTGMADNKILYNTIATIDTDDDRDDDLVEDSWIRNSALTFEARFYAGKKSGARGFYLSVMGRYSNFDMETIHVFHTNMDGKLNVPIRNKFTSISGGLGIGAQWLIARKIIIDFYVIGGTYGTSKGDVSSSYNFSNFTDTEKQTFLSDLSDSFTIGDHNYIDPTISNNSLSGKSSGPIIGIRGAGLSVGFAF